MLWRAVIFLVLADRGVPFLLDPAFSLAASRLRWPGELTAAAVAAGMWLLGGMQIRGFATTGSTLALAALAWLGANVLVGVAEEFWFRSYMLQSLWRSIGFWPASTVIALLFAADHYFFK